MSPHPARLISLASACLLATPAIAQRSESVSSLWNNMCVACHGKDGKGGGAGTRTLHTKELFSQNYDRVFFDTIKNGRPGTGMEAMGQTLSDEQVWGLVVHIRELQAAALRAAGGPRPNNAGVYESQHHLYSLEKVITDGLTLPWAVAWLPDGAMLVTERAGRLRIWKDGKLSEPVAGLPVSREVGQGGLMDVAVHPEVASNGFVYLAYNDAASNAGNAPTMTTIVRGKLTAAQDGGWNFTDQKTIFMADKKHYIASGVHFGCRIVFGPQVPAEGNKRHLYFSIGERGQGRMAQDLARPNGKIHRVWDDGSLPTDNPFVSKDGADATIWSFGHRNPQGLVFDLAGNLWDTEHGPRGGDELNLIQKGRNYGWPLVAFSINYNDAPLTVPWPAISDDVEKANVDPTSITLPVDRWLPSVGVCGLAVMGPGPEGEAFPAWKGDLFAGGLSGQSVDRFRIKDGEVVEREEILRGLARVRDVKLAPDGTLYVVFNDPDQVVRLVPVQSGDAKKSGS